MVSSKEMGAGTSKSLLIRIDVDSVMGLSEGTPFYLDLLDRMGFKATFFIPLGPNRLLRAACRRLLDPGFWKQCYYMKPWQTYFKRRSSSDLGCNIGLSNPDIMVEIEARGHEVGLHGYDHAYISNRAYLMTPEEYRRELERTFTTYVEILGHPPSGTASPAWRSNETMLKVQDKYDFKYASDMFGLSPTYVKTNGYHSTTLQLPTNTDPVFPLVVNHRGDKEKVLKNLIHQIEMHAGSPTLHLHTEYEFVHFRDELEQLFNYLARNNYKSVCYNQFAADLKDMLYSHKEIIYFKYPGAFGYVAGTEHIISF